MDSRVLPGAAAYHRRHSVGQRSLIPRGAQDLRLGVPRSSFTLAALVKVHARGIRYADRAGRNFPRGVRGEVSLGEPGAARRDSYQMVLARLPKSVQAQLGSRKKKPPPRSKKT